MRIKQLGCFEVGDGPAPGAEIVRRMEPEFGMRRDADFVVRNDAETMVQADEHSPSMMTVSPEARMASYLSRYFPIRPPRSPAIRTAALLGCTPANTRNATSKNLAKFIFPGLTVRSDGSG